MRGDYVFDPGELTRDPGGFTLAARFKCGHTVPVTVTCVDAAIRLKEHAEKVRCSDCTQDGKKRFK